MHNPRNNGEKETPGAMEHPIANRKESPSKANGTARSAGQAAMTEEAMPQVQLGNQKPQKQDGQKQPYRKHKATIGSLTLQSPRATMTPRKSDLRQRSSREPQKQHGQY